MGGKLKVLGFAGSLRTGSYNKSLLRAAADFMPEDASLEILTLMVFLHSTRILRETCQKKVKEFKTKIRGSDAILVATPEYNYSVPGVLKNAIDWASRPYGDNPFDEKPVAIMSASVGTLGGARAQYHLRQIFVFLNMHPVADGQDTVTFAQDKFDANGRLVDENAKKFLGQLLGNLVNWTRQLRK